jgi:hypothetical protein
MGFARICSVCLVEYEEFDSPRLVMAELFFSLFLKILMKQ